METKSEVVELTERESMLAYVAIRFMLDHAAEDKALMSRADKRDTHALADRLDSLVEVTEG